MTRAHKPSQQLELPVMVNVNGKSPAKAAPDSSSSNVVVSTDVKSAENSPMVASSQDLSIYKAIFDNYRRSL